MSGTDLNPGVDLSSVYPLLFNGKLCRETPACSWGTNGVIGFDLGTAFAINEFTFWVRYTPALEDAATNDIFHQCYIKIHGSNMATSVGSSGWIDLTDMIGENQCWLTQAITCKIQTIEAPAINAGFTFVAHTTENYSRYKIQLLPRDSSSTYPGFKLFEITFDYKKMHELEYSY